jgi:hypothetical protein
MIPDLAIKDRKTAEILSHLCLRCQFCLESESRQIRRLPNLLESQNGSACRSPTGEHIGR